MMYLIKLEDCVNKREVMIECPERMILEELNIKIKSELCLPCTGEIGHYFQINGKVYMTDDYEIIDFWGEYDDRYYPIESDIQHRVNYPKIRDIRDSCRFRLNQVFTVKGSVILFVQRNYYRRKWVKCTLIDRIEF